MAGAPVGQAHCVYAACHSRQSSEKLALLQPWCGWVGSMGCCWGLQGKKVDLILWLYHMKRAVPGDLPEGLLMQGGGFECVCTHVGRLVCGIVALGRDQGGGDFAASGSLVQCTYWPSSCTACALRTQRLGYSPKNTCHQSRGWGFLEDPLAPRHKANAQMQ